MRGLFDASTWFRVGSTLHHGPQNYMLTKNDCVPRDEKNTTTKLMVDINILVILPVFHLPYFFHFLVSSVTYKQRMELIDIANEGIFQNKTCSAAPKDVSIYEPILPAYILPRTKKGNQQETLDKITDRRLITNTFLRFFSINVVDEKKAMQNASS